MDLEQLQQGIDYMQDQPEIPNYFSRPEAVSRHIFGVNQSPAKAYNEDTARAYLFDQDLRSVRTNIGLIATLAYAEKKCGWNLEDDKEFSRDEQGGTVVPSRSRLGFSIVLSKTDRRIQAGQMEQFKDDIGQAFGENIPKQGIGEKIRSAIPFLKKTGDVNNG